MGAVRRTGACETPNWTQAPWSVEASEKGARVAQADEEFCQALSPAPTLRNVEVEKGAPSVERMVKAHSSAQGTTSSEVAYRRPTGTTATGAHSASSGATRSRPWM